MPCMLNLMNYFKRFSYAEPREQTKDFRDLNLKPTTTSIPFLIFYVLSFSNVYEFVESKQAFAEA